MSNLNFNGSSVVNFTNRVDIPASDVTFEVMPLADRMFRYRIMFKKWASIRARMNSRNLATIEFRRGGEAARSVDIGNLEPILTNGGEIVGEVPGGFDPELLGMRFIVSDPGKDFVIVASTVKGKPDDSNAEIGEVADRDIGMVKRMRDVKHKGNSILPIMEDECVPAAWQVKLKNVDLPLLLVSPSIGKVALESDPRTQLLILPEVFRFIVTEMALHAEEYDAEPWIKVWTQFAASVSPTGEWAFFTNHGDLNATDVHSRVSDGVRRYREKYIPDLETPQARNTGWED